MAFWKVSFLMLQLIGLELAQDIPVIPDSPADAEDIRGVCCPKLYKPFKNNCYRVFKDARKTWDKAESECNDERGVSGMGHLVSILSKEENDHVANLWLKSSPPLRGCYSNTWIGLKDGGGNSDFIWSDGKGASGYSNWATGKPTTENNKDCVLFSRQGDWSATSCNRRLPFICKIPA